MLSHTQRKKDEKLERKEKLVSTIMFVPVMCLLGIIPLIVRMVYVHPKDGRMNILFGKVNLDDYYSQCKSVAIIITVVFMLVLTYLFVQKKEIKLDKYSKIYGISATIFLIMTIFSALLSEYKEIALWGMYDRAEGLVMWICYIVMMFYTFYTIRDESEYKWIIGALSFLIIVTAVLGAFQYAGYDLLVKTKLGQNLIIPEAYRTVAAGITSDYESHKVLGTLYHYDYVGSFGAMVAPLFIVLTILAKNIREKIILGIVSLAALFILFGSSSRAGLVGLGVALVVGIIIFGYRIIRCFKKSLLVSGLLIIVLVAFNFVTKGSIFSRIPTLIEDAIALLKPVEQNFDYKSYIPVREVIEEDGKVTFVLQTNQLSITYQDETLSMTDGEGNIVGYQVEVSQYTDEMGTIIRAESYTTSDERYSDITIVKQPINVFTQQETMEAIMVTVGNGAYEVSSPGYFYFKLDDTGVHAINAFSGELVNYTDAEGIGFKGKEKLGSARGYIWSRALKIISARNLLIGNGPDTFALYFPQNDLLAKWWAYGMTNITVDKPHNLYLQIAINQGCIALFAFLVLVITYIIQSIKLYALRKEYNGTIEAVGIGITLAVIGYLSTGFFNDSVISVAPIFWILLGTGMATNYIQNKNLMKL